MKINIVNTYLDGGAGKAAMRLHESLLACKHDSTLFASASSKAGHMGNVRKLPQQDSMKEKCKFLLQRKLGFYPSLELSHHLAHNDLFEIFSDPRHPPSINTQNVLFDADVVNIHWTARLLDLPTLLRAGATKNVPVVMTLHDMNAFTGGCHYTGECKRYLEQCGNCPALVQSHSEDASRIIFELKRSYYAGLSPKDLHIVTLCPWMTKEVAVSPLLRKFPVTEIRNSIDANLFQPLDQTSCKTALRLDLSKPVVLFMADSTRSRRKGFDLLATAMKEVKTRLPSTQLVSIGRHDPNLEFPELNINYLGSVSNENLMPIILSAGDVMVVPSRQDNLPNAVVESFACGTPVVAFEVGGIPSMVSNHETGLLASVSDTADLAEKIVECLCMSKKSQLLMRKNCRQEAVEGYSAAKQAKEYEKLFRSLIR